MAPRKHKPQGDPTRAIAYCRVSTTEQAEHGLSLDAQEAALRAYCAMRGLDVADMVIDPGVSASDPLAERKGGSRVLAAVQEGRAGVVVSMKLDRLFRNAADCLATTAEWDRVTVALHLVDLGGAAVDTSTAMGRFMLTVLAAAAEMERNLASERTTAILAGKRARGERTGGELPYGFKLKRDGLHSSRAHPTPEAAAACPGCLNLVPDPDEQKVIAAARRLQAERLSLRSIGTRLGEEGFWPRTRGAWHPQIVKGLLRAA